MSKVGSAIHKCLVLVGLLLMLAGFVYTPPAQAAAATLYDNLVDGAWKSVNNFHLAQSFKTDSQGGSLSEVSFVYRGANESNSGASSSSLNLYLYNSNGTSPDQQLNNLGSLSIGAWSNETYSVPISSSIDLLPNTEYFIVLNGASNGTVGWKFSNSAPSNYIGTTPKAFTSSNSTIWSALTSTFFSLKVVSTPPAVSPTFGSFANLDFTFGDVDAEVSLPTSSAAGSWALTSSDNQVFTVSGTTLSVSGAGTATITASFTPSDTTTYLPGSVAATVLVLKRNIEVSGVEDINVSSETWPLSGVLPALTNQVSGSWSHSGTSGIVINGNQYSISSPGNFVVTSTLTPTDSDNYNSVIVERNLIATQIPVVTPTPTETQSPTSSATPTLSPTPTQTQSQGPTTTPTPTITNSPTPTSTPTSNAVPTVKPSTTPAPSFSPTPQAVPVTQNILPDNFFAEPLVPITAEIVAVTGSPVGNTLIKVVGDGLQPNSNLTVTVYSTPRIIFEGKTDPSGSISTAVYLPADLESDTTHSIVINGIDSNGNKVTIAGGVAIDANSEVVGVAPAGEIAEFNSDTAEELSRATSFGVPLYDAKVNVLTTAGIAIAATSMLALGGAGGMTRNLGGGSNNSQRQNNQAKLANVVTKKLKAINVDDPGYGDLKWTTRPFKSSVLDQKLERLVTLTGRFSALLPRVLVDGSWFRVLFGSGSVLVWISAISLALWDALANPGNLAKPTDWVLFVLILMSFVDALAGMAAFLTISVVALAQGEIQIASDWRMLLGLGVLMTSLPLLVHVIRPLRRFWRGDGKAKAERFFDYLMPPVFVAFAAGSMLKALNGLSGLELVSADQITFIRWAGFFGVLIRMFGEDLAGGLFPKRSVEVNPAKLPSPGRVPTAISIVLRGLTFLFIAEPFFGIGPVTITAAVLIALPLVLKLWEDDLPNFATVHKWFPRGLLRFSITLVVGILLARNLLGSEPTDEMIRSSFIWLLLPNTVVGVVELFGRKDGDWNNVGLKWITGSAIWSFTILLTLGIVHI
jgi:hypothetical protein